jgi:hypothetical protein
MSLQSDLARAHQNELISVGKTLGNRVRSLWWQMDPQNLDASWNWVAPKMVAQVTAAQQYAATLATPYVNSMDRANKFTPAPVELIPEAFTNVMGDGRAVAPALFGAVTNMKTAIGRGLSSQTAFQAGANFIAVVASAALQDMARNADRTVSAAKGYTRYVRVVGGSACSRCAILAGIYSAETAFLRHVSCQCTTAPIEVAGKVPKGFHTDPLSYFDSLSKAEQDRVFTNAGAEAIRQGADPVKVVNARRGAYGIGYSGHSNVPVSAGVRNTLQPVTIGRKADGSPLQVFATAEGTTARGAFGKGELRLTGEAAKEGRYRRTTTVRLMPEQIIKMASTPERWRELLTKYGYIN